MKVPHRSDKIPQPAALRLIRAFTLVELLASVAIAAVLIAVLFSLGQSTLASARGVRCVSNLRQIAKAVVEYTSDHNGFFPPAHITPPDTVDGALGERDWYQYLWYMDIVKLQGEGVLPNQNPANSRSLKTVYHCPANPGRIWFWNTPNYAYNYALGQETQRAHIARISLPAKTVLAVDAGFRNKSSLSPTNGPSDIVCYVTSYSQFFGWEKSVNFDVHAGRANFVMVDGHIESLTRAEVKNRADARTLLWSRDNSPVPGGTW